MFDDFIKGLDIQPGEQQRIILHWTGGGPKPNTLDKKAYHVLIDQNLNLHPGKFNPDDNINTKDRIYAAHTLHANTKAVGLSLCGMLNAQERPLKVGKYPITEDQFLLSAKVAAAVLRSAGLPCTPKTALSHAEVEKTLGIKQKNKWDIAVLPWRSDIMGAEDIGNYWRRLIKAELNPPFSFWKWLKGLFS